MQNNSATLDGSQTDKLRNIFMLCYGMTIIGQVFALGLPAFIALLIAWLQRGKARGTVYESHVRWLFRTALISIVASIACLPALLISRLFFMAALLTTGIWFLYRMLKGLLRAYHQESI
ncbi:MAG: hypothetical protein Q4B13_04300 [Lautropia sp.]|nr:hypothetical protein [Lautropia sp.]